jgi:hypothetical protein
MAGGVAQPLAPACGARAVVGMLRDGGDHSGMEHALPPVDRITATIEVHRSAFAVHPHLGGHLLQRGQPLGLQPHIRGIAGSHRDGSDDSPIGVRDGDDVLALLVLVA